MPESNKSPQGSFTDCESIIKVRRGLYRKDTLLFTSHPVSSFVFSSALVFGFTPLFLSCSLMSLPSHRARRALRAGASKSMQRMLREGKNQILLSSTQVHQKLKRNVTLYTPEMKSHYTLSGEMFCQESYTVYSVCLDS